MWKSKKKLYYLIPVGKYRITKLEFRFYVLVTIRKKIFSGHHSGYRNTIGSTEFGNIKFFMFFFPTQYTIRDSTDFSGSQKKFRASYQVQEYHWYYLIRLDKIIFVLFPYEVTTVGVLQIISGSQKTNPAKNPLPPFIDVAWHIQRKGPWSSSWV